MESVAIAGVGLIGGSFALALRAAGFTGEIVGVSSAATIERALALGVIDRGCGLEQAARGADVVFLAQPVKTILETLASIAPLVRPEALVTDAGSTKAAVAAAARRLPGLPFVGGHPLAGKETRGVESAEAGLFQGRTWVLTPDTPAALETPVARSFLGWLERIGARVTLLDAEDHDRALAFSSHLPQLASVALAASCGASPAVAAIAGERLFGPALVDATRLALSPFAMWGDIFSTNREAVQYALECYIIKLQQLKKSVEDGENSGLDREFQSAAAFAAALRSAGE